MLTEEQIVQYEKDGYLILRSQFSESEMQALDSAAEDHPPLDDGKPVGTYPQPGRYTLAKSSWNHPGFIGFAEHPTIVNGAKTLLGDDVHLTAYVMYDRTPGGKGLPAHHDYKRWRPVGSSMNWLFSIIPFCDYDAAAGRLWVAPGSHHLERVRPGFESALHVEPPVKPDESDFIDPGLERGDLLFMNMHLWHRADGNHSDRHRVGIFNKYAAANAPPATGYFLYDDDVYDALSPAGRGLIAVHSNRSIDTTRLVLTRGSVTQPEVLLVSDDDQRWSLPGGATYVEQAIPDWDEGNLIASLQSHLSLRRFAFWSWSKFFSSEKKQS